MLIGQVSKKLLANGFIGLSFIIHEGKKKSINCIEDEELHSFYSFPNI
jgi:hypothetical protein